MLKLRLHDKIRPVNLWPDVKIKIGDNPRIDPDVILGYPCERLKQVGAVSLGKNARVRSGTIIYQATEIGNDLETGHHVVIREENRIGDKVWVWSQTVIDYGCIIGSRVRIHSLGYVCQMTIIEDDVFIAPGVIFGNDKYPVSHHLEGPRVCQGARIGVNATILPGVIIGAKSMVGGGSVVTRNVPEGKVVAGNPARVICDAGELTQKMALRYAIPQGK